MDKLRNTKKIKQEIRYMATIEVQPESGALHVHMLISFLNEDEMFGFIEFLQDYKRNYTKGFQWRNKTVFPLGRSHIGVSQIRKKSFEERYRLKKYTSKADPTRTEYRIETNESREFKDGTWTVVEFYTESMMKERYEEDITKYLVKTVTGQYSLDHSKIAEGVAKCLISHDTKTLVTTKDENYYNYLYTLFIRQIAKGKVYSHSKLPFPWSFYQKYRKQLITYDKRYKAAYNCCKDLLDGNIYFKNSRLYSQDHQLIAGGKNASK